MFNLDNIICFFSTCIAELVCVYCFKIISNQKEKKHWFYLFLIPFFSFIITLEFHYGLETINTISSLLSYFILYFFIFRKNSKEIFFYGMAIYIIALMIDIFTMFRTSITSKIFSNLDIIYIRAIDTLTMLIILMLILRLKKLNNFLKSLYNKIKNIKFPYLRILLLLNTIFTLGFTILYIMLGKNINEFQVYLYLLTISVIILVIVYINKEYNNYTLKETNEYLIKTNEFYINIVNDYRILKHNIIHQLNSVKTVSNKKAISLIDDLIKQYNENETDVHNIKKMPVGISGIVYEKIYSFNNKEIKLGIENSIESNIFDNLTPRSYNLLCEALGILMDNALQATVKTKEKILMIEMKESELNYQIKIINTFQDLLDLEKLGTIKYTTKNSGYGIGLFSLIGRRKLKLKTSIINDLFLNEIIIEKHLN